MAEFEYRLAVGWITKAALEASDSYLLTNLPVASDQVSLTLNPWGPPADDETLFPAYRRYGLFSDETQWADGAVVFTWSIPYFTEGMLYYWEVTLIFGDESTQQKPVTVKTRKANGNFGVFQCVANRAVPNVDYKRGVRGVTAYKQHFVQGVEIFA